MKRFILAVAVVASLAGTAQAQGYHGGYGYRGTTVINNYGGYRGGYYGGGWGGNGWGVAGAVVGGMVVGAAINAATQPVYVPAPQPVYMPAPQPVYQQPVYQPPVQVSCVPAYDQFGRYLGCMR